MVDHELKTEDRFSYTDKGFDPSIQFDMVKRYSRDEGFRDLINSLQNDIHSELFKTGFSRTKHEKTKSDTEPIRKIISKISFELLNSSQSESECTRLKKQLNDLEYAYKYVLERFLQKMENFLYSCKELREDLYRTVETFHRISLFTAEVTVVSSVMEVGLLIGSALHKIFKTAWNPNLPYLATIVGSISVTTALFALSYMRRSTAELTRDVRYENRFLLDLMMLHHKGNWIDDEVLDLFPHGIDLKLLDESDLQNDRTFGYKTSWRHHLCSTIILTNIQRNEDLLKDENFLTTVKMFVRSAAAEIWWNRRKIKKLLDDILKKSEAISVKEFTADHEVHLRRTALYLYPVMLPLLLNSWNSGRMRFLCSSLALITASFHLANNESKESDDLKRILNGFEKDFIEITEICQTLDNDYD